MRPLPSSDTSGSASACFSEPPRFSPLHRGNDLCLRPRTRRRARPGRGEVAQSKSALAGIGVGGVGFGQLQELEQAGFAIVALGDTHDVYARNAYDRWPQARRYRDFRELLQTGGERIDAVYCGTPDYTHALIVLAALRRKKYVCCVKPLTRTV